VEPKPRVALLLVSDAVQANEVEQLLLRESVAVVRTRVASRHLWQALLRIGVIVLLEGLAPESVRQLTEGLPIETLNITGGATEELLQQLREKNILAPQKGSRQ
jgi:hypothetical protein